MRGKIAQFSGDNRLFFYLNKELNYALSIICSTDNQMNTLIGIDFCILPVKF